MTDEQFERLLAALADVQAEVRRLRVDLDKREREVRRAAERGVKRGAS